MLRAPWRAPILVAVSNDTVQQLGIRGRVQGVGYRWAMVAEARRLGLRGWVRNRSDGTVQALVAGPPAEVQRLIDWARRGPPGAWVAGVDIHPAPADAADCAGFDQRPTA